MCALTAGEVVAFDRKCLRGSKDKSKGFDGLSVLGAWASKNELLLGQLQVDEKSNEIVAMPKLLEILFLKGSDALNCQEEIVTKLCGERGSLFIGC